MAEKECTTRREFVKEVAGAAVAGALIGLDTVAAPIPQSGPKGGDTSSKQPARNPEDLVAPCGLYCGACPMYLASQGERKFADLLKQFGSGKTKLAEEDLVCDGCLGKGRLASFCKKCAIRECAAGKSTAGRCSDCKDFACSRITGFNSDGMLHHAEVLVNLRHLREVGLKDWAKREEERWRCPQCRDFIAWYDPACPKCGAKRPEQLFPLKKA